MIHLGDITKINGADVPIVDVICGGSPCQDLSVAGKRAGLAGERSGLFMDQIRIIKEMREHDRAIKGADVDRRSIRPRYMVWENVPGAFSSNKGEDFRAVLEETAKVVCENAVIPRPSGGKWSPSGCIMGDGWSIAWRVHDAQFWGVPQRRKRISLVADFGGETAPQILFERKGVFGDIEESGEEREGAATNVRSSIEETGRAISFQERAGKPGGGKGILIQNEHTGALSTLNNQSVCYGFNNQAITGDVAMTLRNRGADSDHIPVVCATTEMTPKTDEDGVSFSLRSRDYKDPQIVCLEGNGSRPSHQGDGWHEGDPMYTLNSTEHHAVAVENHPADSRVKVSEDGMVQTLSSRMGTGGGNVPLVMGLYSIGHDERSCGFSNDEITDPLTSSDYKDPIKVSYQNTTGTLSPGAHAGSYNGQDAYNDMLVTNTSVVRRLTPLECERLQGFPNHWTNIGEWIDSKGKKHKDADSPRYKALGNSIALPFWQWMASRMVKYIDHDPTMASLFDGIGGFPLVFSRVGCKPVWASEIEEFPIAVTKYHFPEDNK